MSFIIIIIIIIIISIIIIIIIIIKYSFIYEWCLSKTYFNFFNLGLHDSHHRIFYMLCI